MTPQATALESLRYELRFASLFVEGRGFVFPCDAHGDVDVDALGERARLSYRQACAAVGRELALPAVLPSSMH